MRQLKFWRLDIWYEEINFFQVWSWYTQSVTRPRSQSREVWMLKHQDQLPLPTFFKIVSILLSTQAHHLRGGGGGVTLDPCLLFPFLKSFSALPLSHPFPALVPRLRLQAGTVAPLSLSPPSRFSVYLCYLEGKVAPIWAFIIYPLVHHGHPLGSAPSLPLWYPKQVT